MSLSLCTALAHPGTRLWVVMHIPGFLESVHWSPDTKVPGPKMCPASDRFQLRHRPLAGAREGLLSGTTGPGLGIRLRRRWTAAGGYSGHVSVPIRSVTAGSWNKHLQSYRPCDSMIKTCLTEASTLMLGFCEPEICFKILQKENHLGR